MNRTAPMRHRLGLRQNGFTLVELMVALALGLLIALAASAALLVARQGFTAVDAGSQLRENARFAADLMQRIVVQAGYVDVANGRWGRQPSASGDPYEDGAYPGLLGYDNAWAGPSLIDPTTLTSDSRPPAGCAAGDTTCANGSDILIVRYQGATDSTTGQADGSMINCAGMAEPYVDDTDGHRAYSIFHVLRTDDGEPALACTYFDVATNAFKTQSLVKGVEGFQVLYGTDGVTPNLAPPTLSNGMKGTVDRYLTAKEMMVGGSVTSVGTINNWRRVRSVRISLLFRGDVGSMATRAARTIPMRDADGTTFLKTADTVGDSLAVLADGRLRSTMIFTIHLRNQQGFNVCTTTTVPPCP